MRTPQYILLFLLLIIGLGWSLWYLAFGNAGLSEMTVSVPHLQQPVEILWDADQTAYIHAETEADALAALGFAHAMANAWPLLLWRQTALGETAQWFGTEQLPLDQFCRALGLAELAQTAYEQLATNDQARLQAYTNGINSALDAMPLQHAEELLLFDLEPDPWQPWHTLAVTRLFAWLAVPALNTSEPAVAPWITAQNQLFDWLHVHGFNNSAAWTTKENDNVQLYFRLVYGTNAETPFQPVALRWGQHAVDVLSIPGTLLFPVGQHGQGGWVALLQNTATLETRPLSTRPDPQFVRLQDPAGNETLHEVFRDTSGLFLPTASTDSITIALRWSGLQPHSDLTQWLRLFNGSLQAPDLQLFQNEGFLLDTSGQLISLNPAAPLPSVAGGGTWQTALAEQANRRVDSLATPAERMMDPFSAWAKRVTEAQLAQWSLEETTDSFCREAAVYMQNWDYRFDEASIGATLFAANWGTPTNAFLPLENWCVQVNNLIEHYGADLSQWRWDRAQATTLYFPVWSTPMAVPDNRKGLAATRYAPIDLAPGGHPSAWHWGAPQTTASRPAPAAYTGWMQTNAWGSLTVHPPLAPLAGFLSRQRLERRRPDLQILADAPTESVTRQTLIPANHE